MRRFYLPQPLDSPRVMLRGAEAKHLSRVLRLGPGDEIALFNGQGGQALSRIEAISEEGVALTIMEIVPAEGPTPRPVTLATAVPKGERFDWLVEKATELGVARLIPLVTARSVVNPRTTKLDRLRRTIVEASKQCGRDRLLELAEPLTWNEFIAREFQEATVVIADPSGEPPAGAAMRGTGPVFGVVGPEGGLTPDELEPALCQGARLVTLGPFILRVETAAVALAAHLCNPTGDPV